ncbi:hypothetical protein, partial [Schnuerera sp.]|uniref:hypothetical protein n=1 Tax=Schnuerera sp. TaxID=2794844 RepID=UPI002C71C0D2
ALNEGIIQPCYIWEDIIFSHAGVSKTWCTNHSIKTNLLEMSIQDLFEKDKMAFGFQMPHKMSMFPDWSGDDVWQSPLWIRPKSLHKDKLDGYRQVVGHSQVSKIAELDGIILIDYLPNGYLVIEDGEFKPVDL